MKQASLFDDPMPQHCRVVDLDPQTLAKAAGPATSHAAAREIVDSGTAASQAARIEAVVHRKPYLTADEIARELGDLDRVQVGKRLPHIKSVKRSDDSLARRCSVSKRVCCVWFPAPTGEAEDE